VKSLESNLLSYRGYALCDLFTEPVSLLSQDAGIAEDNDRIVKETVNKLGGLDIIIANAGWTRFSEFKDLNAMTLEEWNKVRTSLP
jgi:NAD(P)-dependent dehydrogenase (short-subunit alcohol dehydrogenase family)